MTKPVGTSSMHRMNTLTGYESFQIPTERVEELQKRVEKLNKKATKLGTPAIDLIVTDNTRWNVVKVGGTMALRMGTDFGYETTEVHLKGETPKLNGWEFLSVVLHRPAGNEFVNTSLDVDLSAYDFAPKKCDHCNINRVRNATFLVRHTDGTIKQVGSSCLEDYTGVKSPQAHAKQIENIFNMFRELRGGWGTVAGRTTRRFFLVEWMAFVNMEVRTNGYVNRNKSYDTGLRTTADMAKMHIVAAAGNANYVDVPTDADFDLATEQINWIRTDEAKGKIIAFSPAYGEQLIAAAKSDSGDAVSEDTMAILAPLAPIYARHIKDQNTLPSVHVGTVGEKLLMTVKCVSAQFDMDYGYGPTNVFTFLDENGNKFSTMTKNDLMENGKTYTIEGKVKKHSTYRNIDKTDMNYVKVICGG